MAVDGELCGVERVVRREWSRQLGVAGPGPDEDFFAVGGNSLQAAEMVAALSREFGTRLRLTLVLRDPVPADLVRVVAETVRRPRPHQRVPPAGRGPDRVGSGPSTCSRHRATGLSSTSAE